MHGEVKVGNSILMLAAENPQMNARTPTTLGGTPQHHQHVPPQSEFRPAPAPREAMFEYDIEL